MDASSFVSRLTPHGRGAVATIRVNGVNAGRDLAKMFRPRGSYDIETVANWRICFGKWGTGAATDEELVLCRKSESTFDLHCHGGDTMVDAIMASFVDLGYAAVDWTEISDSTDEDRWQIEARHALTRALTEKTAGYLARQRYQRWSNELDQIDRWVNESKTELALERIEVLLRWYDFARHLVQPWRVVIAGHPNVGKSSLINLLLGFNRSIVQDQPGTTRDVVSADTVIDGWPIQLLDTAGQRVTDDEIELSGVQRAQSAAKHADLLIWVADITRVESFDIPHRTDVKHLIVANKIDLANDRSIENAKLGAASIKTSCTDQTGIDRLIARIAKLLVPSLPPDDLPLVFSESIHAHLSHLKSEINSV